MAIRDIIHNNGTDPDILDIYGTNAEDLLIWLEVTECELEDLEIEFTDQIARVKSYENLIKFRGYKQGVVYDLTKAYNSIKTTLVERHVHRLWFHKSESEPWLQYGFNTVQFGDHPAAAIMSLAMERASETSEHVAADLKLPADIVKKDADKLLRDTYVDDISCLIASSLEPSPLWPARWV